MVHVWEFWSGGLPSCISFVYSFFLWGICWFFWLLSSWLHKTYSSSSFQIYLNRMIPAFNLLTYLYPFGSIFQKLEEKLLIIKAVPCQIFGTPLSKSNIVHISFPTLFPRPIFIPKNPINLISNSFPTVHILFFFKNS